MPESAAASVDASETVADQLSSAALSVEKPAIKARSTANSFWLIFTCTMAMLVNSSNNTSVAISLPTIGKDLDILEAKLQWLGCLLLMFGRLADLYGRKRTFLLGSAWLAALTLGCGFAKDEITLDILRGFQGVGVAASIPASLGILAHAFPPGKTRSLAFATFAAGAPLGAFTGMALGATLTQLSEPSWRANFFLSCGLTVLYMVSGFFCIDADLPSTETDKRVDWLGHSCDGEVAPDKWATPYIIACLIIGVFLIAMFILWQWHLERVQANPNAPYSIFTPPPLMKLSLWTRGNGKFSAIMAVAFLTWCAFLGWNFWAQLYYQSYKGYTPVKTMIRLFPMFVVGIICNVIVVMIIGRVSVIWILGTGTLVTACASIFFARIDPNAPYWAFGFPSAIFSVFGADFVFAAGTIFVARIVLPHEQSLSGALFQTMTQLGTALGVTVTTIVFNRVVAQNSAKMGVIVNASGSNAPSEAALSGYQAAQWTAFAFGIIATIITAAFMRGVGIVGDRKTEAIEVKPDGPHNGHVDVEKGPQIDLPTHEPMREEIG
ncbi:putative efflux transporter [Infundibulicybe gibba]|nr:putative efflux transporter [Infundibulicybe gibba]